jgi:hypothetical protein
LKFEISDPGAKAQYPVLEADPNPKSVPVDESFHNVEKSHLFLQPGLSPANTFALE